MNDTRQFFQSYKRVINSSMVPMGMVTNRAQLVPMAVSAYYKSVNNSIMMAMGIVNRAQFVPMAIPELQKCE